ncbi:MAG TPA: hypothetical protein VFB96_22965 [Pirellulaceae bacterium]|nr:hypothetical protein [Pirellulaceae bacterium]
MARKVVNRKELRAETEAAAAKAAAAGEAAPAGEKKKKAPGEKKAPAKRKSRAKSTEPARMMLFWGVFNQSLKRVAKYDFTQKRQAEAKAAELSAGGKSPHFVQKVKEPVEG